MYIYIDICVYGYIYVGIYVYVYIMLYVLYFYIMCIYNTLNLYDVIVTCFINIFVCLTLLSKPFS